MNKFMLESCVHPWNSNNVYKDKCKRFVSSGHEPFTFIFVNSVGIPKMYSFLTLTSSYEGLIMSNGHKLLHLSL
jgi:hypothetical protein